MSEYSISPCTPQELRAELLSRMTGSNLQDKVKEMTKQLSVQAELYQEAMRPTLEMLRKAKLINARRNKVGLNPLSFESIKVGEGYNLNQAVTNMLDIDINYVHYLQLKNINFKLNFLKFSMNLIEGK